MQNPKPVDSDLKYIDFFDNMNGVAAGRFGALIRTNDGGNTWERIQADIPFPAGGTENSDANIVGVHYPHADTIKLFVSYSDRRGNYIIESTDGGNSWSNIPVTITDEWMLSADFADVDHIYAGGKDGILAASSDGGNSWDSTVVPSEYDFHTVFALDRDRALAGGAYGQIWYTDDGGQNWTEKTVPGFNGFEHNIHNFFALSEDTLFAGGSRKGLLRSFDGGENWDLIHTENSTTRWYSLHFTDTAVGYAGYSHNIHKTVDGGRTWAVTSGTGTFVGCCIQHTNQLVFFGNDALAFNSFGIIFKSNDGGNSWEGINRHHDITAVNDVSFSDSLTGIIVADQGASTILKTTDGGQTWETKKSSFTVTLYKVAHLTSSDVVAAGNRIYRSEDGGENWTYVSNLGSVREMCFVDDSTGYVVNNDSIYKTVNRGITWTNISENPHTNSVSSMHFTDENTGWITFGEKELFHTADGGQTWTSVFTVPSNQHSINDIWFTDADEGYYVCAKWAQKGLYRTTDGGASWTPVAGMEQLYSLIEVNGSQILLAGMGNTAYSEDGGDNWIIEFGVSQSHHNGLHVSPHIVYIAGENGLLVKRGGEISGGGGNGGGNNNNDTTSVKSAASHINAVKLYPNPSQGTFTINLTDDAEYDLEVFDVSGMKVLTKKVRSGTSIDLSNRSEGLYFIKLSTERRAVVKKLIIQ